MSPNRLVHGLVSGAALPEVRSSRPSALNPLRVCHQLVAKHRAAMTRADLAELLRHRRRVEGDGDTEHSRDCLLNNCVMIVEMHEELLD